MSTTEMASIPTGNCAQCGVPFRCGMDGGDAECWCARLPPLLPLPESAAAGSPAAGCLCPACLQARLDLAQNGKVQP